MEEVTEQASRIKSWFKKRCQNTDPYWVEWAVGGGKDEEVRECRRRRGALRLNFWIVWRGLQRKKENYLSFTERLEKKNVRRGWNTMWLGSITNVIFHIECFFVVVVDFRFLFLLYYFFFHFFNWDNLFGQGLCGDRRLLLLGKLDRSLSSRRGAGQQAVEKSRDQSISDRKKKKNPRDRGHTLLQLIHWAG